MHAALFAYRGEEVDEKKEKTRTNKYDIKSVFFNIHVYGLTRCNITEKTLQENKISHSIQLCAIFHCPFVLNLLLLHP